VSSKIWSNKKKIPLFLFEIATLSERPLTRCGPRRQGSVQVEVSIQQKNNDKHELGEWGGNGIVMNEFYHVISLPFMSVL
jgi:hypothetical protein